MIQYILLLAMVFSGIAAIYMVKQKQVKKDYIWVGEGKDPFRK